MSFVIKKKHQFSWPVKIKTPADGGEFETSQITLIFAALDHSELKKLMGDSATDDKLICNKVVCGWKDVQDESGKELEFNKMNFEMLLEGVSIPSQIAKQYLEIFHEAAVKN